MGEERRNLVLVVSCFFVLVATLSFISGFYTGDVYSESLITGDSVINIPASVTSFLDRFFSMTGYASYVSGSDVLVSKIYPLGNFDAYENNFFNISFNVSCLYADCGDIDLSLFSIGTLVLNPVMNGDFEMGDKSYWTGNPESDVNINSAQVNSGSYSLNLYGQDTSCSPYVNINTYVYQNISLDEAANLTFNYYVGFSGFQDFAYFCDGMYGEANNCYGSGPSLYGDYLLGTAGQWVEANYYLSAGNHSLTWFIHPFCNKEGNLYLDDICILDSSGECIVELGDELVGFSTGDDFYTNGSNPLTVNLAQDESSIVDIWLNTNGEINLTQEFFLDANITGNLSASDRTDNFNVTIVESPNYAPTTPTDLEFTEVFYDMEFFANASGSTDINEDEIYYYYEFYNVNDSSVLQAYSLDNSYIPLASDINDTIEVRVKAGDYELNSSVYSENVSVEEFPEFQVNIISPSTSDFYSRSIGENFTVRFNVTRNGENMNSSVVVYNIYLGGEEVFPFQVGLNDSQNFVEYIDNYWEVNLTTPNLLNGFWDLEVNVSYEDSFGEVYLYSIEEDSVNVFGGREVDVSKIYPLGNFDAYENNFFNISFNVSCLYADCGDIDLSLFFSNTEIFNPVMNGDFETGDKSYWTSSSESDVSIDSTQINSGSYSMNLYAYDSGCSSTSAPYTYAYQNISLDEAATLNFNYYIITEENYDFAYFCDSMYGEANCYIDGYRLTGDFELTTKNQWVEVNYSLSAGNHTLTWVVSPWCLSDANVYLDDICILDSSGECIGGLGDRLVGFSTGDDFYTNGSNPLTMNLAQDEYSIVDIWLNANGEINVTEEFFLDANIVGSNIGDRTEKFNITIVESPNYAPTTPTDLEFTEVFYDMEFFANASGSTDINEDEIYYYYEFYNVNDSSVLQAYSLDNSYIPLASDINDTIEVRVKAGDYELNSSVYSENVFVKESPDFDLDIIFPLSSSPPLKVVNENFTFRFNLSREGEAVNSSVFVYNIYLGGEEIFPFQVGLNDSQNFVEFVDSYFEVNLTTPSLADGLWDLELNISYDDLNGETFLYAIEEDSVNVSSSDSIPPYFTDISNITVTEYENVYYDINASDNLGVDSFWIDNSDFSIDENGVLRNETSLNSGYHYVNVSVNDSSGNTVSEIIWVNVKYYDLAIRDPTNQNPKGLVLGDNTTISFDYLFGGDDVISNVELLELKIDNKTTFETLENQYALFYYDDYSSEYRTMSSWNAVDGSLASYARFSQTGYMRFSSLNYSEVLGDIEKVETRVYFDTIYATDNVRVTPYFSGQDVGDSYYLNFSVNSYAVWSEWIDVTDSANSPSQWSWSDVENLDMEIYAQAGNPFISRIDVRVTYSSSDAPDFYYSNGAWQVDLYNLSNYTTGCKDVYVKAGWDSVERDDNQEASLCFAESDTDPPIFTHIYNVTIYESQDLSADYDAEDFSGVDTFWVNDSRFTINSNGLLEDATSLSAGVYALNVSVNDTLGNTNSTVVYVTVNGVGQLSIELISPTGSDNSQPQYETFTFRVNISCVGDSGDYCGSVSSIIRQNNSAIQGGDIYSVPFYSVENNPSGCGSLSAGDSDCSLSWSVNATGEIGSVYRLDATASSSIGVSSVVSDSATLQIIGNSISIILSNDLFNVDFGESVLPGSYDVPAVNNTDDSYELTCYSSSGECNVSMKANDHFRNGINTIAPSNVSWNFFNDNSTANFLSLGYSVINDSLTDSMKQRLYFWFDVPQTAIAGDYRSNFTIFGQQTI